MLVSGRSPVVGAILCMLALPVLIGRTKGDRLWVVGKSWSIYLQGDPQDAIDHQDAPTSKDHRQKSNAPFFLFFGKRWLFQKLGLSSGLCFLIWRRLTTSKPHVSNRLRNWPSLPSSTCQGLGYLFLWGNAPAMDEIPPIATEPDCVPWNCRGGWLMGWCVMIGNT